LKREPPHVGVLAFLTRPFPRARLRRQWPWTNGRARDLRRRPRNFARLALRASDARPSSRRRRPTWLRRPRGVGWQARRASRRLGPALKRRGRSCALSRDSFGSRGLGPQCRNDEREVRPSRERVADAEAALRFLVARADVDPKAVSLLGWSNDGSTTLYAVEPKHAPTGVDFARAIAFYPGCRLPLEHGWKSRCRCCC
jgi:hypothetical protein